MRKTLTTLCFILLIANSTTLQSQSALVLQTDFGTKDGAVAAMKGVAFGVSSNLPIFDLTHEIPAYNIWQAAYRLNQAAPYWPKGTVFVSVVDPGVGTDRKSVVMKSQSGHYFVTPDNGTLTLVAESLGIDAIREIDESVNRLKGSEQSHTFHGRDVYAFTGARLASNQITFEQVGKVLPPKVVTIPYPTAEFENGVLSGNIPILDVQYGNVWTNIERDLFNKLDIKEGTRLYVTISRDEQLVFAGVLPFVDTFGDVAKGEALIYFNSLNKVSLAINQGSFAGVHDIGSGPEWRVQFTKSKKNKNHEFH